MRIKNTNTTGVGIWIDPIITLMSGEVMEVDDNIAKEALKIKGVVKTKEAVGVDTSIRDKAKKGIKKGKE